jgi:GxxExxY protein
METLNDLSYAVIGMAYKVHTELGPGLLESVYETCITYELIQGGYQVERQVRVPIHYNQVKLDAGFRIDLLVNGSLVLELKAIEKVAPIHKAQLMTYLRLSNLKLGLLLNFNVFNMREGIHRVVM